MRASYKSFKGINLTVWGKKKKCTSLSWGGGVGAGVGRVGQLNLCVEAIHYFEGINVTVSESLYCRLGCPRGTRGIISICTHFAV